MVEGAWLGGGGGALYTPQHLATMRPPSAEIMGTLFTLARPRTLRNLSK